MYSPDLQRLCELETQICSYHGCACRATWLDEYFDIGLNVASDMPEPWQEGWLRRMFNTLCKAISSPLTSQAWRQQCLDYLYQPFFVLAQMYHPKPNKSCHLCDLLKQYHSVATKQPSSCCSKSNPDKD